MKTLFKKPKNEVKFAKFDRKNFSPETSDTDLAILYKLRNKGWTRRIDFRKAKDENFKSIPHPYKFSRFESTAFWYLRWAVEKNGSVLNDVNKFKGKVFCDFGCGQSPDGVIALELGAKKSIAVDLCNVRSNWENKIEFIKADICEKLPIKPNSVDYAISQAVIDLIEPEARTKFYKNALNVLKPGSYFTAYIIGLHVGHGFNIFREIENAMDAGFHLVDKYAQGFVLQKV